MPGKASYRVESDALKYGHIVKSPNLLPVDGKAVCGKNPFPDRWYVPFAPAKPLCPNCWKGSVT